MNHNFITITNDIRKIRNIIKNQEIIIKKIIILSFINFFVNIYNSIYNNYYNYE